MYSSALSVFTAVFEIITAMFALRLKGRKNIRYTSVVLLLLLASYQIMEISICSAQHHLLLARIAFIIIIWLPSVGILLISHLFPVKRKVVLAYSLILFGLSFIMVVWIFISKDFVSQSVCKVVFVRYSHPQTIYIVYSVLYQLGLLSMLFLSAFGVIYCKDDLQRKLLGQVLLGSILFIIPALITVIAIPETTGSLPSVMCHFALLLAFFVYRLVYLENINYSMNYLKLSLVKSEYKKIQ